MNPIQTSGIVPVGVGLRHQHFADALETDQNVDFVEVHAENFFADGGAALSVLDAVAERLPLSLHATSLGLGSFHDIPMAHVGKLKRLVERYKPALVSDHASFAWSMFEGKQIHAGDLLPIGYDKKSLDILAANVSYVQDILGRTLLVENIAAYVSFPGPSMGEPEFLTTLCQRTGCRLLVDINNLVVNATNRCETDMLKTVRAWIRGIPTHLVGEIHLAGCSPPPAGELMIDDHSRPVSSDVWNAYRTALRRFGPVPTLIEWDNDLPSWGTLIEQAEMAREIGREELGKGEKHARIRCTV